jgi:zinc transport system substrate-binding protein
VVRAVGGGAVVVHTLLPPGVHPDTYEAPPRVAEALARAGLVVRVGGVVDDWVGQRGKVPHLVMTELVSLRGEGHHHDGHDHGVAGGWAGGGGNPHVWLDPILVRDALLPRLVDALVEGAPEAADEIRARGVAFADSLTALDGEIRALLEPAPIRRFVSAHPAWLYFAERYGLEEIGSLHPSPGAELGVRELARLVTETRRSGRTAVIAEPQLGRAGVETLARELSVPVGVADPVGGDELEGRGDYLSLMRYNASVFARALGAGDPGERVQ